MYENNEKLEKSDQFLILIYCSEYSLLKISSKSDLIAAVNEIHVAMVVFELNSQVLTLTLTATHAEMF